MKRATTLAVLGVWLAFFSALAVNTALAQSEKPPSSPAIASHPPGIASITVCSPNGAGGQGSCTGGNLDTHQIVLAPDGSGNAFNRYNA